MGGPGWKTVPFPLWKTFLEQARKSDVLHSCPAPCRRKFGTSFLFPVHIYVFQSFSLNFPQKSLPRLEDQIKEAQQQITEELRNCGTDIPEDESGKLFFLIDVSMAFASS